MKKIGVLTVPIESNYGGILQAYALMTVLKKIGLEPILIYRRQNISFKGKIKKFVLENLFNIKKTNPKFSQFISNYINPKTEKYFTTEELVNGVQKYDLDAYIVGSDQVWRKEYSGKIFYNFFLDFISENNKIRKISYAASFGKEEDNLLEEEFFKCKELLQKFDYVSVRENSAVNFCKEKFNVDATQVLDPTLLLNKNDYLHAFDLKEIKEQEKKYLVVYYLDETEEKRTLIEQIKKQSNYHILYLNTKNIKNKLSVEEWINGFSKADFVITDSFHGCVFSILFNKNFLAIGNKDRGLSRFTSLLSMFNLENRLLFSPSSIDEEILTMSIDWENVNSVLDTKRKESLDFLNQALK